MKKTYLWTAMLCTAIAFSACKSNKAGQDTASEAKTEEAVIPGSDKDEHGCVGSAGYVWSERLYSSLRSRTENQRNPKRQRYLRHLHRICCRLCASRTLHTRV